jgi:hypothetical protein
LAKAKKRGAEAPQVLVAMRDVIRCGLRQAGCFYYQAFVILQSPKPLLDISSLLLTQSPKG